MLYCLQRALKVFCPARSGFIEFVWWVSPPRTSRLIWVGVGARVTAANPRLQPGLWGCNL